MKDKKFISYYNNFNDLEIETDTGWESINSLYKTIKYKVYIIKTKSDLTLKCADNHIVFDNKFNEVFVKDLHVGDKIQTKDGIDIIKEIIITDDYENMYDFELTENSNHRYFTNNILSHNTEIARSIANLLNVPFTIVDVTSITASGYVGEDVESIITRLLQNCDYDVERAEHGIIFLDEFDKLAKTSGNRSITRDVSGEGVQQGLLKLIEGTDAMVPPQGGRKHPEQKLIKVNTKDILFIVSGAFVGLEDIIYDRLNEDYDNAPKIGFGSNKTIEKPNIDEDHLLEYVQPEDIIQFGMIPEIVGRLPIITNTNYLSKKSLQKILTEPQNAIIKQYQKLFSYSNVELTFTKGAIERLAEYAEALQTGARGLRTCVERVLKEPLFNAPDIGKEHSKKEKDTMFKLQIKKKDIDRELKDFIKIDNK